MLSTLTWGDILLQQQMLLQHQLEYQQLLELEGPTYATLMTPTLQTSPQDSMNLSDLLHNVAGSLSKVSYHSSVRAESATAKPAHIIVIQELFPEADFAIENLIGFCFVYICFVSISFAFCFINEICENLSRRFP